MRILWPHQPTHTSVECVCTQLSLLVVSAFGICTAVAFRHQHGDGLPEKNSKGMWQMRMHTQITDPIKFIHKMVKYKNV